MIPCWVCGALRWVIWISDDDLDIWVAVSSGGVGTNGKDDWIWYPAYNLVGFNDNSGPEWGSTVQFHG
jgi:hypothetical protein